MRWFKHDANANRDAKLEKVLMRYGAEGYALYWLCLELIAEPIDKHNITFELEHDAEILAYRLRMDSVKVEEIMRFMVSLDLFEVDATSQKITCLKLASRLENSIVKNPKLKEIQGLITERPHKQAEEIPDNPGQSGKNPARLDQTRSDQIKQTPGFFEFWKLYPRKEDKKKAERAWGNLSKAKQEKALVDIKDRYEGIEKQFIPLATTYMHGERWEDERIKKTATLPPWQDDKAWEALGRQYGITAKPRDSWNDFKGRIKEAVTGE